MKWSKKVKEFSWSQFWQENKVQLLVLAGVVMLLYANALGNEFVSDDIYGIVNVDWSDFSRVTRAPLSILRALEYWLINGVFGKSPAAFRLMNIFFHMGTAVVAYGVVSLLINRTTAFLAAILMAVHPLQVEAVSWISGGVYVQAAMFGMLSLGLFLLSLEKESKYYIWSLVSLVLALQVMKRMVAMVGVMGLLLLVLGRLKRDWKKLVVPVLIGSVWFGLGVMGIGIRARELESSGTRVGRYNPLIQIPVAVSEYLKLVVWPKALTLYHSDLILTGWQYVVKAVVTVGFLVSLVIAWFKDKRLFFWGAFFWMILSPSLLPLGVGWVVAERYAYLAALGLYVVIAIGVARLSEIEGWWEMVMLVFGVVVLALGVRTVLRNQDWKSHDTLWLAAAKYSQYSPQNHNNLGDYYGRQGDYEKAIEHFKQAIELREGYADAHHNLANVYLKIGELDKAEANYQKALAEKPQLWQSYQQLGAVEAERGSWEKAEEYLRKAMEINDRSITLWLNMAVVYKSQGEDRQAMEIVDKVLQADPRNRTARQMKSQWR